VGQTLHARILALVSFARLRPTDIGTWIELDAVGRDFATQTNQLLGYEIGRARLVNRTRLRGTPHLRPPPTAPTIAKLLSPSGGTTYGLSTMMTHLRYIVVYCANELYGSDDDDRKEQVAALARSMYKAVANDAIEQYELLSAGDDPEDDIDLRPARQVFTAMARDDWININAEINRCLETLKTHSIEARQLSAAFLLGDRPSIPAVLFASADRVATQILLSEIEQSEQPIAFWIRGAVGSGKSTILYQLSTKGAQRGWRVFFTSGLTLGRLESELLAWPCLR